MNSQQVAKLVDDLKALLRTHRYTDFTQPGAYEHARKQLVDLFANFDPDFQWDKIIQFEEHLDKAPGTPHMHFAWGQAIEQVPWSAGDHDHEIPQWFRDHIAGIHLEL